MAHHHICFLFLYVFTSIIISSVAIAPITFSVSKYGAKGDGMRNDRQAFLNAWNAACQKKNARILVPKGKTFLVHPVTFSGPCAEGITFLVRGTIIAPQNPDKWQGLLDPSAWISITNMNKFTMQGGGIVDGKGYQWWAQSCKVNKQKPCKSAPTSISFRKITNLSVSGMTFLNSPQMNIEFSKCRGVRASGLKVQSPATSPNTDGIHVTQSTDVVIAKTTISTGDDCISIEAGSSGVTVMGVTCGPGHGISIGSLGNSGGYDNVDNVLVKNVTFIKTTNGARIKTSPGGRGQASAIKFQDLIMRSVSNPIIIDQHYCDSQSCSSNSESSIAVAVKDILFSSIVGTSATNTAIYLACSSAVPCQDIHLQNIHLQLVSHSPASSFCQNAKGSAAGHVLPPSCLTH